jgi:hypothetical protein
MIQKQISEEIKKIMKNKLFENIGGNRFKLLTEERNINESLIASGVKKVFMNAGGPISYKQIESVGMGYIKDINTAKKVALQEARILAKEFGYKEDENKAKFVKENDFSKLDAQNPEHALAKRTSDEPAHDETNMENPEEKREVQIGREIIKKTQSLVNVISDEDWAKYVTPIQKLARELIEIHGQQV